MTRPDDNAIIRYFQGQASESDLKAILEFVKSDPEQAASLFQEQRLHDQLVARSITEEQTKRALAHVLDRIEMNESLDEEQAKTARMISINKRQHIWLRIAAVFIGVMLVGAGLFYKFGGNISQPDMMVAEATRVQEVNLPDGSKVWLNKGARLEYPEKFSTNERHVKLNGEGYFEVTKDPKRQFVVEGAGCCVRVFGTKFDFRTDHDTESNEVTLLEGSVGMRNDKTSETVMLTPGQKGVLNPKTGKIMVSDVNAQLAAVWHDNLINFENAGIAEIATVLEQLYGMDVVIDRNVDLTHTYSGTIQRKGSIDSVMNLLQKSIPIHYYIRGKKLYILP